MKTLYKNVQYIQEKAHELSIILLQVAPISRLRQLITFILSQLISPFPQDEQAQLLSPALVYDVDPTEPLLVEVLRAAV